LVPADPNPEKPDDDAPNDGGGLVALGVENPAILLKGAGCFMGVLI
jgi:hypothetical protein